ncbi:hypothetical protein [Caballeronia sp. GAFFF1]|uniref:hypothetical protein n=1 Tax=Caballeronia sp. GAFFF1 TaxID=2921779 RepID=UPI002027E43C|nr:hypothetical protein [Caballeronia sp. GAFFF1]
MLTVAYEHQYHLLSAIAPLRAEIQNRLLNERETSAALLALVRQTEATLLLDNRLKQDLLIVESLIVLKRWQMALDRLQEAIMGTYMR